MKALVNRRVFDGERLLEDVTVLIDGERVAALHDAGTPLPAGAKRTDLAGHLLAPGFIDVQHHPKGPGRGSARFHAPVQRHDPTREP